MLYSLISCKNFLLLQLLRDKRFSVLSFCTPYYCTTVIFTIFNHEERMQNKLFSLIK